jgi:Rap1a immunity proteins
MRRAILVAVALSCFACLPAGQQAHAYFYDGNRLFNNCQEGDTPEATTRLISWGFCTGYIMGAVDAVLGAGFHKVCIPNGVAQKQMRDVVTSWLDDHPEKRHLSAEFLVIEALKEKFPCN